MLTLDICYQTIAGIPKKLCILGLSLGFSSTFQNQDLYTMQDEKGKSRKNK